MAGVVQMGVNEFWAQLQKLRGLSKRVKADLDADRSELMQLWARTRSDPNRVRAAQNQKLLTPLTHQNSKLRLKYRDLTSMFNRAVEKARTALKAAGYTTPGLSGLGVVVAVAPVAAVVILLAAFAVYQTIAVLTGAQRSHTRAVAQVMTDPRTTPEEKIALAKAMEQENRTAARATAPGGFDFGQIVPILGLVALIILGPQLLRAFQGRGAQREAA